MTTAELQRKRIEDGIALLGRAVDEHGSMLRQFIGGKLPIPMTEEDFNEIDVFQSFTSDIKYLKVVAHGTNVTSEPNVIADGHTYPVAFNDDPLYLVYCYGAWDLMNAELWIQVAFAWHTYWHTNPNDISRAIPIRLTYEQLALLKGVVELRTGFMFHVKVDNVGQFGKVNRIISVYCECPDLDDAYKARAICLDDEGFEEHVAMCNANIKTNDVNREDARKASR